MLTDTAASASAATNVSHSQCNGTALSDCLKHVWNVHRNVLRDVEKKLEQATEQCEKYGEELKNLKTLFNKTEKEAEKYQVEAENLRERLLEPCRQCVLLEKSAGDYRILYEQRIADKERQIADLERRLRESHKDKPLMPIPTACAAQSESQGAEGEPDSQHSSGIIRKSRQRRLAEAQQNTQEKKTTQGDRSQHRKLSRSANNLSRKSALLSESASGDASKANLDNLAPDEVEDTSPNTVRSNKLKLARASKRHRYVEEDFQETKRQKLSPKKNADKKGSVGRNNETKILGLENQLKDENNDYVLAPETCDFTLLSQGGSTDHKATDSRSSRLRSRGQGRGSIDVNIIVPETVPVDLDSDEENGGEGEGGIGERSAQGYHDGEGAESQNTQVTVRHVLISPPTHSSTPVEARGRSSNLATLERKIKKSQKSSTGGNIAKGEERENEKEKESTKRLESSDSDLLIDGSQYRPDSPVFGGAECSREGSGVNRVQRSQGRIQGSPSPTVKTRTSQSFASPVLFDEEAGHMSRSETPNSQSASRSLRCKPLKDLSLDRGQISIGGKTPNTSVQSNPSPSLLGGKPTGSQGSLKVKVKGQGSPLKVAQSGNKVTKQRVNLIKSKGSSYSMEFTADSPGKANRLKKMKQTKINAGAFRGKTDLVKGLRRGRARNSQMSEEEKEVELAIRKSLEDHNVVTLDENSPPHFKKPCTPKKTSRSPNSQSNSPRRSPRLKHQRNSQQAETCDVDLTCLPYTEHSAREYHNTEGQRSRSHSRSRFQRNLEESYTMDPDGNATLEEDQNFNGTLDPMVRLSEYESQDGCDNPRRTSEGGAKICDDGDDEDASMNLLEPHPGDGDDFESQPFATCTSVTFGGSTRGRKSSGEKSMEGDSTEKRHEKDTGDKQGKAQPPTTLEDSFDRVPRKRGGLDFAHKEVVRKKEERLKLKGWWCKECFDWMKGLELTDEELERRMNDCSRHRAKFPAPDTPEHFWSIQMPDTQECQERAMKLAPAKPAPPRARRNRPYAKKFKTKLEEEEEKEKLKRQSSKRAPSTDDVTESQAMDILDISN